ncbi:MAG: 3-hydroxyacyl-ACP dehydratase FabZ [Gammaproteobacteria bacterium]
MSLMDINQVLKFLPHRYPFMLIDKIIKFEAGKSLVAVKNVTFNEPFFTGHFPQQPVMPGVLILEALAQAGGVLYLKTTNTVPSKDNWFFLAGIDNARFKRIVQPGDQLQLEVEILREKHNLWKFKGIATVDGHLACSAEIMNARGTLSD